MAVKPRGYGYVHVKNTQRKRPGRHSKSLSKRIPHKNPTLYNSWYECSRAAHVESVKLLSKMGYKNVNDYKVGLKYHCKAINTI